MKIVKTETSTCLQCNAACGIKIAVHPNGKSAVSGDSSNPENNGNLCAYGKTIIQHISTERNRLLKPQMRQNRSSPLKEATWEDSLTRASAVIKTLVKKNGQNTMAVLLQNKCLIEERFLVNKMLNQLNQAPANAAASNYVNATDVSFQMAFGGSGASLRTPNINDADCFLISSVDLSIHHPILWEKFNKTKAQKPNAKLIYIGPTQNKVSAIADIHLQINPGTETVLIAAIARALRELNAIDIEFLQNNTVGYGMYKRFVLSRSIEEAAKICGVASSDIELAAIYIQHADNLITYLSKGLGLGAFSVERNISFINLHIITGHLFKPSSGIMIVDELELSADRTNSIQIKKLFTTGRLWCDSFHIDNRWEYLNYYGVANNFNTTAFTKSLENEKPKIVWLIHPEAAYTEEDEKKIILALQEAKFVILQTATTISPFFEYADIVLPTAAWYEKEGTSIKGSPIVPLSKAKGAIKTDLDTFSLLAKKLDLKGFIYQSIQEIFEEYIHAVKKPAFEDYPGLPSKNVTERSITIHCPKDHLFHYPATDNHNDLLLHIDYDLYFTQNKINTLQVFDIITIHPTDAFNRKIKEGDIVTLTGMDQTIRAKATISEQIKKGVITVPLHLAKEFIFRQKAENLAPVEVLGNHIKFISPVCRIKVSRFVKQKQKLIIVGAGSGALAFIRKYREYNTIDEIVVFSKEELPFYNRVLLPEYIADDQWNKLVTLPEEEEEQVGFRMYKGVSVIEIDKEKKLITDSNNHQHNYDLLILGMGSNAFIPPGVPHTWKGIYTIRSKRDVDRLRQQIKPGSKALIVGAGLVSLEVAGALKEIQASVSLLVRSSRLMDRQLDSLGSDLLAEELEDRGIDIYFNHEIRDFVGDGEIKGVLLTTGKQMDCDVLIYGVGTVPNIELVKKAGLNCNRGVVVNDVMQTSDPSIFAIGEVVEWNRQMFGIVAAAEQQANIAAGYINGDNTQAYQGTLSANILKISGVNVCSIGINEVPKDDPEYQEVVFIDKRLRHYKKCIIHNDKLIGAILIGDKSELTEFKDWMANDIFLEEKRDRILRGEGSKTEAVIGKLVCSCNNVGEGNIVNKINTGCKDLQAVCKITGAGTGCGSCRPEVKNILEKTLAG